MGSKTAVLLLNVGTPSNPDISGIRKFLYEFLNDKRVIDIPWILRKVLVNIIIIPFRARKTAKLYKQLWTARGSPLVYHGISLREKLQKRLGEDYIVEFATNYKQPDIKEVVLKICNMNISRIIAFPLFPQYSSSTTGSVFEKLLKILAKEYSIPPLTTIQHYYDNPSYLEAMTSRIMEYDYLRYDHILISFHGLPLSQVNKSHSGKTCKYYDCTRKISGKNHYCYHAECYATSRLLTDKLNLLEHNYTVCFQSRMNKNWIEPFTDKIIEKLAKEGKKRLLVICPSFTADCLETTIEVGETYRDLFLRNGGTKLTLVESLNDSEYWVNSIAEMIYDQGPANKKHPSC